jgi:hypothetical protein
MNDKIRGAMAAIQALNGIAGLYVAVPLLIKSQGFSGTQIVLSGVIALSISGTLAGYYLWRGNSLGFWLSAAFQFPQLIKINSDLVIYQVELGTGFDLILFTTPGTVMTWGYRANFYLRNQVPEPQVAVNLVALLFLYLVYRGIYKK